MKIENELLKQPEFIELNGVKFFPETNLEEENELKIGKWYNYNGALLNYQGINNDSKYPIIKAYGIVFRTGEWHYDSNFGSSPEEWVEATESEVLEALTKEAVKRGFKNESKVKRPDEFFNKGYDVIDNYVQESFTLFGTNNLCMQLNGSSIYERGIWAEIVIETITREEAEKQLGLKIID